MKVLKIFAVATLATILAAPCRANVAPACVPADQTSTTTLTKSNGTSAGAALLSLYTQYKTDGKIDMTNVSNIANVVTLANNIKGLKSSTNTANFVKGLISGSKKLVNTSNSSTVLSALKTISGLDLSSMASSAKSSAKSAAKSAATTAATNILSSITSSKAGTQAKEVASAASTLTSLFKTLKK
jgi:hypothetical protein